MNPPFSARRGTWIDTGNFKQPWGFGDSHFPRQMPIEAAFVLGALCLLKSGGTLLAILPPSIVAGESMKWLRQELFKRGHVCSVHELPEFCFSSIESRMYLFVYRADRRERAKTLLLNHDLGKPEKMRSRCSVRHDYRLDFGFHRALQVRQLLEAKLSGAWLPLTGIANLVRGQVSSPFDNLDVVHTAHFENGLWSLNRRPRDDKLESPDVAPGEILVRRVGRDCAKSFGLYIESVPARCSDCVFVVKPHQVHNTAKILFWARLLTHDSLLGRLVEKGTGASYLTKESLAKLRVPSELPKSLASVYRQFQAGLSGRDRAAMDAAELKGRAVLQKLIKPKRCRFRP